MFKKSTLIVLFTASLFTACKDKKEEECVAPAVEKNIVGTWQAYLSVLGDDAIGPFPLTFTADGKIIDEDNKLAEISGQDPGDDVTLSWKKTADGIEYTESSDFGEISTELEVTTNECNHIVLGDGILDFELKDKK